MLTSAAKKKNWWVWQLPSRLAVALLCLTGCLRAEDYFLLGLLPGEESSECHFSWAAFRENQRGSPSLKSSPEQVRKPTEHLQEAHARKQKRVQPDDHA